MNYIGVDPGNSGAMVSLDGEGLPDSIRHDKATDSDLWSWLQSHQGRPVMAVIERVSAMPGQGVSSTFKFGTSYGKSQGMLIAAGIPFEFITPRTWQKALSIKKRQKNESKTDFKRRLKGVAQRLFPNEKIVNANADAFLIAEYCRRKHSLKSRL